MEIKNLIHPTQTNSINLYWGLVSTSEAGSEYDVLMRPVLYLLCSSKRKPKLISINLTQMCPCIKMCSLLPLSTARFSRNLKCRTFFHMNKRPLTSSPCQRSSHNTDYVDHHQINICVFSNDWFSRAEGRSKSSDWVSFIMSYSNWNDVREYGVISMLTAFV